MKATSLNRSTSKARPALRLVSTKELPREDWQASLLDTPRRTSSSSFFTTPSPRGHRSRESREMPA